jgi:hypothetical protein
MKVLNLSSVSQNLTVADVAEGRLFRRDTGHIAIRCRDGGSSQQGSHLLLTDRTGRLLSQPAVQHEFDHKVAEIFEFTHIK